MGNLQQTLSEHPFFAGLSKTHLELMAGCASIAHFAKGTFVFRAGGEASEFYLIRHGRIALETSPDGRKHVGILDLSSGDVLGWSWLVAPYHWKFDARVLEATRAIKLDGKCLRAKWEKDHDLGFQLLQRFTLMSDQRLDAVKRALSMVTEAA